MVTWTGVNLSLETHILMLEKLNNRDMLSKITWLFLETSCQYLVDEIELVLNLFKAYPIKLN